MTTQAFLHEGQYQARTRWGTHESGAAFDRKKTPYLTEYAQEFIAQQAICVMTGLTLHNEPRGMLVLGEPGLVKVLDESTCLLNLENRDEFTPILQSLYHALSIGREAWLGLFFICHPTRERLCVQGTVEMLSPASSMQLSSSSAPQVAVRLHVQEAFFHCSKYIRTRIAGLTIPESHAQQIESSQNEIAQQLLQSNRLALAGEHCRFLRQQVLCFLCTVNREGRCAVNHRGGASGFLVPYLPGYGAPRGVVLLPDFAGNGAFEAIGNILETVRAALVVPDYVHQVALSISGAACVIEPDDLAVEVAQRCAGAERIIALAVQHIEVQSGDWSVPLAYELDRAESLWADTVALPATLF